MSTTINTATPLFEHGPTIDDLHADDTVWHIGADLVDEYLEQLGNGPDRKQLKRAEQRCEHSMWPLGLRDGARAEAGLVPIMTQNQAAAHPLAATWQMKVEQVSNVDYFNPRFGWPGDQSPDFVAYTIHCDTLEAVARVQRQRQRDAAMDRRLTPCVVCGLRVLHLTCDACRPILEHARLIATAEQPIDGNRTRLDAALDYARNDR